MTSCQVCATPLPTGSRFCYACGSQVPGVEADAPAETPGRAEEFLARLRVRLGAEYDIEREIGRGGMGIVYLAHEKALDRHVALKVLPPALAFDESIVERFLREARLVARLDHPNLVPIHRVGQSDDITYFAMKYVTGGSLQSLLKNTPQLPLGEAQRILVACAHALGYAHTRGIVHRDVKPANILLDTGGRVYVTDLGIAKAVAAEASLTASGALVGTPMYMSPEQSRGEPADTRSDQYSLAIVGYQMLAGRLPFEDGKSMEGILYDRLFTDPNPLETHRPDAPNVVRYAIQRAMSREPQDRFASMDEFAAAVAGEAPGQEVLSTPPIGATVRYTPARGSRIPGAAASGAGLRAEAAPARRRTALWAGTLAAILATGGGTWLWLRGGPDGDSAGASPQVHPAGGGAAGGGASEPAPQTTPTVAKWRLAESLPAGANLTLDGLSVRGDEGELEPGTHSVRVTAANHEPWEETRTLSAGDAWRILPELTPVTRGPADRRPPVAERRPPPDRGRDDTRLDLQEPPEVVLLAIRTFYQEGRAAHDDGQYVLAVERYRKGLEGVVQAERAYRRDGTLGRLRRQLEDALKDAAQACRLEGQPNCPKP